MVQSELSEPEVGTEGVAPARLPPARRADRRRFEWRGYVLLSPGLLVTSFVFVVSMGILLSYSFREFVDGRIQPGYSTSTWHDFLTSSFDWGVVAPTVQRGAVAVVAAGLGGSSRRRSSSAR